MDSEDWSDWEDAQVDLRPRWVLILLCLTSVNNTDFCYFDVFYFLKLPEKARIICIHARVCLSPFIMSYCRRVVIYSPLSFTTGDASHCSYNLLVGPTGGVKVVSLMWTVTRTSTRIIDGNIWEHIQCQIEQVVKTILHIYAVDRPGAVHNGCQTEDYGFRNTEQ